MNTWLPTLVGVSLIFLGIWETFMAVLHPRAVTGPVTSVINRGSHRLLKTSLGRSRRVVLVNGPLLVVTQVLAWFTLLLLGASLIVWPQLGHGITASGDGATHQTFVAAVYYAGFTFTTLGVGDLVPRTPAMQLLTIMVAGIGFCFFTLVLAYVISVYSTLARRNQFSNEIDFRTGRTGDTFEYLKSYLTERDSSLINQDLYKLSSNMAELLESHHFYPVLHYFRFHEPRYAMSRMLRFCLEVASMMRAIQQTRPSDRTANTEAVDRLWHASRQMLEDTKRHFIICDSVDNDPDPRLAMELSRQISDSPNITNDLVAAFMDQQAKWHHDLHALAVCTGGVRPNDF
jgi:hypothetical protein